MKCINRRFLIPGLLLSAGITTSQTHDSNWLRRTATDTTVVRCLNDSLTHMRVPPGSMGMMFPDSMYCRIEIMPLDSIPHPYDSTVIGWCRIMLGEDSLHFNYMNCDSTGSTGQHMMQFMGDLQCRIYWDSLRCDSSLSAWRPTGMMGWTGTGWAPVSAVSFDGNTAGFSTSRLYSAYAFTGSPSAVTSVEDPGGIPESFGLSQNYPNPFNPTTTIQFRLAADALVTLKVYNTLGQVVVNLLNRAEFSKGEQRVVFNATSLASGLYYYQLVAEENKDNGEKNTTPRFTGVRKMLLVR